MNEEKVIELIKELVVGFYNGTNLTYKIGDYSEFLIEDQEYSIKLYLYGREIRLIIWFNYNDIELKESMHITYITDEKNIDVQTLDHDFNQKHNQDYKRITQYATEKIKQIAFLKNMGAL